MRTSLIILVTSFVGAVGAARLVAQEPTAADAFPATEKSSSSTEDRKFLLAQIDAWQSGFRMECRHEVVHPGNRAKARDTAHNQAIQVFINGARSDSMADVGGDPWNLIDVIRTPNGETLLSSRTLAPGVAVYDNGEERIVQTTFGKTRLAYQARAADLLSMLDPVTLREAIAQAKITRAADSTGRTRITATIGKPKLFRPLHEKETEHRFAGWSPPTPKIMSLALELTMAASGELERLRFDVQRSTAGHGNGALGNVVFDVADGVADVFFMDVNEDEAVEDVREVKVVEKKKKGADKDQPAKEKKKDEKKKPKIDRVVEIDPAGRIELPDAVAFGAIDGIQKGKKAKLVPGHRDVYTLTPARKKSRRQTNLLRDMRRATGM